MKTLNNSTCFTKLLNGNINFLDSINKPLNQLLFYRDYQKLILDVANKKQKFEKSKESLEFKQAKIEKYNNQVQEFEVSSRFDIFNFSDNKRD